MKAKKILSLVLALALCFSLMATAFAESADVTVTVEDEDELYDDIFLPCLESVDSLENVTLPLYVNDVDDVRDLEVTIVNGTQDVAFLSLESVVQILNAVYEDSEGYELTLAPLADDLDILVLTRENGATMTVDYEDNRIIFSDIDLFAAPSTAVNGIDMIGITTNGANDNTLIYHTSSFYRNAEAVTIDMDEYCIPMIYQDGTGYLPLQTVADLLISRASEMMVYNTESVIITGELDPSEAAETEETQEEAEPTLYEIYHAVGGAEKSEMLTVLSYNELCMALDYCYGLQEEHEITSFNHLFTLTGLTDKLMSANALDTFRALTTLTFGYFADLHSNLSGMSYLAMADDEYLSDPNMGYDMAARVYGFGSMLEYMDTYSSYRALYYPDGCPGYEEVGDTAYITFDTFVLGNYRNDPDYDYFANEPTNTTSDTLELIMYANGQIKRENSPIKNVVIDLTNNRGGEMDAAVSVVSWMLGSCNLYMQDAISGAQSTTTYNFDTNRDGQFDENDYLGAMNYNLYCLISPCSFSCGNLVPAALSANHFVTLIGDSTSGGACAVYPMTTADGIQFTISGPYKISTMNNGIYYSVDQGVNPDDYIDKLEHLYDREYLNDYIDNLA